MEEWAVPAKEVLSQLLKNEEQIQAKRADLGLRLERNNIHIYVISEDVERGNLQDFIIILCHHLGPKPPQNASP